MGFPASRILLLCFGLFASIHAFVNVCMGKVVKYCAVRICVCVRACVRACVHACMHVGACRRFFPDILSCIIHLISFTVAILVFTGLT